MHPGPQGTASSRAGSHSAFPARGQRARGPSSESAPGLGAQLLPPWPSLHYPSFTQHRHCPAPRELVARAGGPSPGAQGCPPLTWYTLASFLRLPEPPFAEPHGAACHVQGVPERLVSLPRPSHPAGLGRPLTEGSPRPRIWTEALSPPAAARKAACRGLASECCPRSHVPGRSGARPASGLHSGHHAGPSPSPPVRPPAQGHPYLLSPASSPLAGAGLQHS